MITCPFEYVLSDAELKKLGEMSLTWSHMEHIIANCLKSVLAFSDDEANAIIFQLTIEQKLRYLKILDARLNDASKILVKELDFVMKGIQPLRNSLAHGILINDRKEGTLFHNRSKDRTFTKEDVFACEEFTNYAASVVLSLRYAIGIPNSSGWRPTLPQRPGIPTALLEFLPTDKKASPQPPSPPRPSGG